MDTVKDDLLEQLRSALPDKLSSMAQDIRWKILQATSENGGHLASNLGAVELTMALHRVLHTPEDKIIWDVGHQCYTHKLLTGRWDTFDTLRQTDGISGFPKVEESPHDSFDTGHSSTSLSIALGMARARDMRGEDYRVVAVMGDGALTGGVAWEAINDAGHKRDRVVLVLNDNTMSIRPNVGSVASYLARMRSREKYGELKRRVLSSIGKDGALYRILRRTKQFFKYLMINGIAFEEMGWTYLGPIDGHNIQQMEKVLSQACTMNEPVIVHVVTDKGRGYNFARLQPGRFHGVGPFVISSGLPKSDSEETTDMLTGRTILQLAAEKPNVVALTAAMTDGCGLAEMAIQMPEKVYDVGIAEQHLAAQAAGLAAGGLVPYVCIYSTFLQRCWDQVVEEICLNRQHVVLAISHTGLNGHDGETHQGLFTYNMLLPLPNMTVLTPFTRGDLRSMLRKAYSMEGPVAICFARNLPEGTGTIPEETADIRWSCIDNPSSDSCIVAVGNCLQSAKDAAATVERPVDVYGACILQPLFAENIQPLLRYSFILCVEDNVLAGGFGQQLLNALTEYGYGGRIKLLGYRNAFIPQGDTQTLYHRLGMDAEGIARALQAMWGT